MKGSDVVRRLESYAAGAPTPRGSTVHIEIADGEDLLLLTFVRMGGESLPWGVAFAHDGEAPTILTVPEPRDRDRVAGMMADLTPVLLRHLDHPDTGHRAVTADMDPKDVPFRQLWVPNSAHLQMLHFLNFRYTFAKQGEADRVLLLNALGRLAGWAFREAQREGQMGIVDASAALQGAYTFPADDLRQQHLGFLLAWLETHGTREARSLAAEEAERESVSITLDPSFEREQLESRVEAYGDARRAGDDPAARREEAVIHDLLADELARRIALTQKAVNILRADTRPVNDGCARLVVEAARERLGEYLRVEEKFAAGEWAFVPSPDTDDHSAGAAAAYLKHTGAAEAFVGALIHHDHELQHEAISAGDAFAGPIISVKDRTAGQRATTPVWTVETSSAGPTRIRRGSKVCVAGLPSRDGVVLDVSEEAGKRRFEIEIRGWKTKPKAAGYEHVPHAADAQLEGKDVTFVSTDATGLSMLKRRRVWSKEGPGAWLTHTAGVAPDATRRVNARAAEEIERLMAA